MCRYRAHGGCAVNVNCFLSSSFYPVSPWEVHLKQISSTKILPGHMA